MYNMHLNMNSLGLEDSSVDEVHALWCWRPDFDLQDPCEKDMQQCAPALSVLER